MTKEKLEFNNEDAKKVYSTIAECLMSKKYDELNEQLIAFEKYLRHQKLECIITSKTKVIYVVGKRLEKNLFCEISDYLKDCIGNEHLSSLSRSYLQITNNTYVKSKYHYEPIVSNDRIIGSLIIIFKDDEDIINFFQKFSEK